ncbi:chloride channel protein, partial [Balneolaceae bacterium ANBcel3]|nr:chloride channel protein [Balneolaceae bacterium ANBcel3]
MSNNRFLLKTLATVRKHAHGQRLILFLSILSGIFAGLAALAIKNLVFFTKDTLAHLSSGPYQHYLLPVLPAIGILATILFSHGLLKKNVGHGIPMALYAISKNKGKIQPHNMFSSIITSTLTVGFGGSAGLEGPSVVTGAAWGSNIGRLFGVSHKKMILLIACSSAGAMAAIFKAPVAGIVFVLEVLMLELTMASIIPLLLAALSGALVAFLLTGMDVVIPVDIQRGFLVNEVPFFILFGVLAGFLSAYFTKIFKSTEHIFDRIKSRYSRWFIGSMCLAVILFFFPSIYGEGFEAIHSALRGSVDFVFDGNMFNSQNDHSMMMAFFLLIMILFLKIVATSVTFGSGGVGGIFAPSLFMGALLGLLFVLALRYFGIYDLPVDHFV